MLAWVPVAGTVYSVGSAALLLYEGVKAKAGPWTLARMAAYMAVNSAMSDVPVIGWAMDTLFRGQLMAANALQKDIEGRWDRPEHEQKPAARRESRWKALAFLSSQTMLDSAIPAAIGHLRRTRRQPKPHHEGASVKVYAAQSPNLPCHV